MIAINIENKSFSLPENWEELIYLKRIQITFEALATTSESKEFDVLLAMTGIEKEWFAGVMKTQQNSVFVAAQILDEVLPIIRFVFEPETLKNNPFTSIVVADQVWECPDDVLRSQKGFAWEASHHAICMYRKTQDSKWLHALMAANYRPQNMEHSERHIDKAVKLFEGLPFGMAFGFFVWYQNSEKIWQRRYPYMFASKENEAEDRQTKPAEPDPLAVRKLLFEIADNKMDSTWEEVKNRNRSEIMFGLDILEDKRIKRESNG